MKFVSKFRSKKNLQIVVASTLVLGAVLVSFFPDDIQKAQAEVVSFVYNSAVDTTWTVPEGVTSIEVKAWGAGGGGGAGADPGEGGEGGGGAFASGTLSVTPGQILKLRVGGGGVGSTESASGINSAGGGGGGGYSGILNNNDAAYLLAAGGGGGGGGDNSNAQEGGDGGAGGSTTGVAGSASLTAGGGGGGGTGSGGAGGSGGGNSGTAGAALAGGAGADGRTTAGADGGGASGGTNGGAAGGDGNISTGFAGGGGGGAGRYGGGGGSGSASGNAGGGGGGGGSSYATTTTASDTALVAGSGTAVANSSDTDYSASAGVGGDGGGVSSVGNDGNDGLVVISYTSPASTWNATDWTDRVAITIDTDNIDATLTNFPVFVDLADMPSYFFSSVRSDCGDIRVMNSSLTVEMPREIVSCNTASSTGEIHFKADSISSSVDTTFYIYFNNTDDYPYEDSHTYGAQNVWTNDYVAVYHLGENGNTTSGGYRDSTSFENDGTGVSMTDSSDVVGQLGAAQNFDGSADRITAPRADYMEPTLSVTVSLWMFRENTQVDYAKPMFYGQNNSAPYGSYGVEFNAASDSDVRVSFSSDSTAYQSADISILSERWHYLVSTLNAGTYYGYNNGVQAVTGSGPTTIGDYSSSGLGIGDKFLSGQPFAGAIDELRIASTTRTAAWIKAEYYNQSTTTDFYVIDAAAPTPNPPRFSTPPDDASASSVDMTAITATDSSDVEYYFAEGPGGSEAVAFDDPITTQESGWSGYTLRNIFPASAIIASGDSVRVTVAAGPSGSTYSEIYVGHPAGSGDPYDFDGNQVQLTFNSGQTSVTLGASQSTTSDDIAFNLDESKNLIVAVYSGASNIGNNGVQTGFTSYYDFGNDAATTNTAAYSSWSNEQYIVETIEVTGSSLCGNNAGTGGTDSGWQGSISYTDSGLQANKCYEYTLTARDIHDNYGATSTASSTFTAAAVPAILNFSNISSTTIDLTNDANGNPTSNPVTYFAVQISTTSPSDNTWDSKYVDASGDPSDTAVWLTDAQIDGLTVTNLNEGTGYTFRVKARNENQEETSFSTTNSTSTLDNTAPTPNPMTFATDPDDVDQTSIDMVATTATDAGPPPVEYLFTHSACASNGGTGGTSSGWQSSTDYTDTGLQVNKCYAYSVTARDSLNNTTTASGIVEAYTAANVPLAPSFSGLATSTANITNNENSNPASNPVTYFALQIESTTPTDATWDSMYTDGNGDPSVSAVWLTDAQLDALVISDLNEDTTYSMRVKARNGDLDETAFSSTNDYTTYVTKEIINLQGGVRLLPGTQFR